MTPNDTFYATGYGPEWQLRQFGQALIDHEDVAFHIGEDAEPGYYIWTMGDDEIDGPWDLREAVEWMTDGMEDAEAKRLRESVKAGLRAAS